MRSVIGGWLSTRCFMSFRENEIVTLALILIAVFVEIGLELFAGDKHLPWWATPLNRNIALFSDGIVEHHVDQLVPKPVNVMLRTDKTEKHRITGKGRLCPYLPATNLWPRAVLYGPIKAVHDVLWRSVSHAALTRKTSPQRLWGCLSGPFCR